MNQRHHRRIKNKSLNFKFLAKGQSLLEVIIAFGAVAILAISLIATSLITQRTTRNAQDNIQGIKLAQQNVEQMRAFRDRKGFISLPGTDGCYTLSNTLNVDPTQWNLAACSGVTVNGETITASNTTFTRKIILTSTTSNEKRVNVIVTWNDSGGSQSVTSNTFLSSWCSGGIVPGSPCP